MSRLKIISTLIESHVLTSFHDRSAKGITKTIFSKQKALIAILVMFIIMAFSSSNFYASGAQFLDHMDRIFIVASPDLIIAFGVTLAVICRGCDLSVGAVMSMSGVLAIYMLNAGMPVFFAVAIAILSGSVVGFINGFLIVQQKTEAFIITLGMGLLIKGVALYLTNANPITSQNAAFNAISNTTILGLPSIVMYMLLIGVLIFCLLRFTSFGRNCYALGGDYEVAEHSGINVLRTKWIAFVITGTCAAIAGVLYASRVHTGSAIYGDLTPLMVNCGVVIGGTSFAGGIGGIPQSFVGIMVMHFLRYFMRLFRVDGVLPNINPFVQTLVLGIVIVAIIAMDCYTIKRKKEDV